MSEDRSSAAADRRQQAGRRAEELRQLRERLDTGGVLTPADVELAELRRGESSQRSEEAYGHAAAAHRRAAEAHRTAAAAADRAGETERAAAHREAAESDDDAALQDLAGGNRAGRDDERG